jgi:hypothetical protein
MAKTTYRTWITGETVTAAQLNEQIRDNGNASWVGTTKGDIDYYNSATQKIRLPIGSTNQFLTVIGGVPVWTTLPNPYTTKGDMIYSSSGSTQARLPIGLNGQVLITNSTGIPDWVGPNGASITRGASIHNISNNVEVEVANFVTEIFDTNGYWASGNKITIPATNPTSAYLITAYGYWDGHETDNTLRELGIKVGAVIHAKTSVVQAPGSASMHQQVTLIRELSPGETVTMVLLQKSGVTLAFNNATLTVMLMR